MSDHQFWEYKNQSPAGSVSQTLAAISMYWSSGKLKYEDGSGFRLVVEVNEELADYYFSLIPKYLRPRRPRWKPHGTVVRPEKEIPPRTSKWGDHEGEVVSFMYDPYLFSDDQYVWIDLWCNRLEVIREELGLPNVSRYTLPPSGFVKCFHCTIANFK